MTPELFSPIWQMRGVIGGVVPGILHLSEGRVSYANAQSEIFNVPLSDLQDLKWPFIQFGYGFDVTVAGQKYKFTFMKPNGAPELDDSTLDRIVNITRVGSGIKSVQTLFRAGETKKTAKEWRAAIGG